MNLQKIVEKLTDKQYAEARAAYINRVDASGTIIDTKEDLPEEEKNE